jgi:pantoate--beta-alanine ligase
VTKLFNIVQPDCAYFGQKDAQQLAVIQQMVRDLNLDVTVIGCPIIREADGLAKSSRNSYLSADERKAALVLSQALEVAKQLLANGEQNAAKIRNAISKTIQAEPLAKVDYVELVDARTLKPVDSVERPVLVALAVYIGKTRLIDNFITE